MLLTTNSTLLALQSETWSGSQALYSTDSGMPKEATISPEAITWRCEPFHRLAPDDLYAAMQLRQRVFVVEQKCPYLDADGIDQRVDHLLGWRGEGESRQLVAYARLVPPGVKYSEPSVGRVASHPDFRRNGTGKALMREAIARVEAAGWGSSIRIAAQMYLERFYSDFGFVRVSEPYLDDDIWHVDMLRG